MGASETKEKKELAADDFVEVSKWNEQDISANRDGTLPAMLREVSSWCVEKEAARAESCV
jgi:hypothetical protein